MTTDREPRRRRLTIYTTDEVVDGLEAMARRDERPVSEMTHLVLRWYLRDQARRQADQRQS